MYGICSGFPEVVQMCLLQEEMKQTKQIHCSLDILFKNKKTENTYAHIPLHIKQNMHP